MSEDFRTGITREDIEEASQRWTGESPTFSVPRLFYDLLEQGKRYPPKAVVGLAARRALGRPLRPDEFSGGEESWAFRFLRDLGFTIVTKVRSDRTGELPETPPDRVWIEDTRTAGHGHGGPGWEFGSWLWSPSSADGGSDYYALMREPATGDIVIHFNDGEIVGWSRVAVPRSGGRRTSSQSCSVGGTPLLLSYRVNGVPSFPALSARFRLHGT